jgi:hypothetical protein
MVVQSYEWAISKFGSGRSAQGLEDNCWPSLNPSLPIICLSRLSIPGGTGFAINPRTVGDVIEKADQVVYEIDFGPAQQGTTIVISQVDEWASRRQPDSMIAYGIESPAKLRQSRIEVFELRGPDRSDAEKVRASHLRLVVDGDAK